MTAEALLEEALRIRMYGERAPGGNENWCDWERKAEAFLRAPTEGGMSSTEPGQDGMSELQGHWPDLFPPGPPNTRVQVVHLSREELEQRKQTLLGLLQVFELYTRYEVEENLAEVEYLLGKGDNR